MPHIAGVFFYDFEHAWKMERNAPPPPHLPLPLCYRPLSAGANGAALRVPQLAHLPGGARTLAGAKIFTSVSLAELCRLSPLGCLDHAGGLGGGVRLLDGGGLLPSHAGLLVESCGGRCELITHDIMNTAHGSIAKIWIASIFVRPHIQADANGLARLSGSWPPHLFSRPARPRRRLNLHSIDCSTDW